MKTIENNNMDEMDEFWTCSGTEEAPHPPEVNSSGRCNITQCQKKRPSRPTTFAKPPGGPGSPPQKDQKLLIALAILNLGSGFTTMYGAAKIFPSVVGYPFGATVQALLFLLLSGSTLKHNPKVKWFVVACFSSVSIYTSFFAYYDVLAGNKNTEKNLARAISAHESLVSEVFTPIQSRTDELKSELEESNRLIEEEKKGRRASGQTGCGNDCKSLINQQEDLQKKFNQISTLSTRIDPLFKYDTQTKSQPKEILDADRRALGSVKPDCFPLEPDFICLPEEYVGSLDPNNPNHQKFSSAYSDEALDIPFLTPILKIQAREGPAIFAAIIAAMVDGCIILLGANVEIRKRPEEYTVDLGDETGSSFLDGLFRATDSSTLMIDLGSLEASKNISKYQNLLQSVRAHTHWLRKDKNEQHWDIDPTKEAIFVKWLTQERERQIKIERSDKAKSARVGTSSRQPKAVVFRLPVSYDEGTRTKEQGRRNKT